MQRAEPSKALPGNKAVRLRAHHLLCALTFRSRGYGADFVGRFESLIDYIMQGNGIQLTEESDELCKAKQNCGACDSSVSFQRDQSALLAFEVILPNLHKAKVKSLHNTDLMPLRKAFADGSARAACEGCSWFNICSHEAKQNFRRARLQPNP